MWRWGLIVDTNKQLPLPIVLSVVGHTNAGKTSLIRTLLRNTSFGQVDSRAGTTRHVEAAQILLQGKPFLELRDTPGLEDSVALADRLQKSAQASGRDTLQAFIASESKAQEFEQEIKVIKQILISDILLYVIDCREPVLEKYRFELRCLSMAARPIIPVLNFIGENEKHKDQWRKALADQNFHALVEFDTVAFRFDAEIRLYKKFQTVLEKYYDLIEAFVADREQHWHSLQHACIRRSAEFIVGVARIKEVVRDSNLHRDTIVRLQNSVRLQESSMLKDILQLLQFSSDDVHYANIPVADGRWTLDLFAPDALKKFGVDTASAAATGAAIGAGLDLMFAGLSLGMATATGAAIGASWNTVRRFGGELLSKYRGQYTVGLDEQTLTLVLARQMYLLGALFHRGHAAQMQLDLDEYSAKARKLDYSAPLKQLKRIQNLALRDDEKIVAEALAAIGVWMSKVLEDDSSK